MTSRSNDSYRFIEQPIFLVGSVRSGTTLLRLMLDGHPRIAFNEEFEFAVDCMPPGSGFPSLTDYQDYLATDRIFLATGFRIDPALSYPELVDSFLVQRRAGKEIVGATIHRHFDRLLRIWPDARFIHMVRDGRAVARSIVEMGWAGNLWAAGQQWLEIEQLWDEFVKHVPADRVCPIRYEDLLCNPVNELTRLCGFFNIDYHDGLLSYPNRTTYSLPDPAKMSEWRGKIDRKDLILAEAQIGTMLQARGYELTVYPPVQLSTRQKWLLQLRDRSARTRFRLRRYGFTLLLQNYLARRLGWRAFAKKLSKRFNEIDNRYVK